MTMQRDANARSCSSGTNRCGRQPKWLRTMAPFIGLGLSSKPAPAWKVLDEAARWPLDAAHIVRYHIVVYSVPPMRGIRQRVVVLLKQLPERLPAGSDRFRRPSWQ